ncbi:putative alpha-1,2-mannosidase [Neolewinella xylanilytica]|uniref:Putative alpha-1,2-mannosidase n=1 Tax=Neolewinella xylanilytica TaxID=1514080 RepID=A0A2S6I6K7_9BACT|nr:GH92 family glycosyl hydrolase [Neolewinella xylanilytica]PPK87127.1 putative alpha-1,2-mannosidase [Neolewinella xylanilytica]
MPDIKPVPTPALLFFGFLLLVAVGCKPGDPLGNNGAEGGSDYVADPLEHVNPFIGTAPLTDPDFIGYTPPEGWRVWAGLTFPGSSLPNAMVQLSPITEYGSGAGYEYEDTEIIGFTHTNKGHWNLCNIPLLPVSNGATYPFKSTFGKDGESAAPAFYGVTLDDYGVKVRLTSTLRAGFHEYTYANPDDRRVLFDLGRANNRVRDWQITETDGDRVEGVQDIGGDQIYFSARFSDPIRGITREAAGERDGYALVDLGPGNERVTVTVGLSFVSAENARANLAAEIGDRDFDTVRREGEAVWSELLSRVQVAGGTAKEQELFYSSLYRTFLWPALRSDGNGEFTDESGTVRRESFGYYTNPSLWDTYRNKLVLLAMLRPEVTGDVIQSMIVKGEESGFMPTFFHGDHAAPFVANAHAQGIDNFDLQRAYELLINNAYKEGGTRPHILEYIERGYISEPVVENPQVETVTKAGVSKTLEYAHDDYALATLAKALGDGAREKELRQRAGNYRNVFDPTSRFMRGRLEDGSWVTPFNPQFPYYEYMYREANGWQVSFYAPHDMEGLVELYGGDDIFEQKLDSLFTVPWNPQHIARNISSFIGQYCHGNQPDHEAPFAYYFVDKPEKSQAILDTIMRYYYGVGEAGLALSGMDDAGEMSAWYVFAAAGMYPLSPADNAYLLSLPIFDRVKWSLPGGKDFVLWRDSNSRQLESVELNGKPLENYFLPHRQLVGGGELRMTTW